MFRFSLSLLISFVFASMANAQVKMTGQFVASKDCLAVISIKKRTNPGNASISAGKSYTLLGRNKDQATHYWIEVPTAQPKQRWVEIGCGSTDGQQSTAPAPSSKPADTSPGTVKPKPQSRGFGGDGTPFYVLALSWEPAFCEVMKAKAECKNQTASSYEASHFSLHGLWPQPRRNVFCNVDRATAALDDQHLWDQLPAPQLLPETKAALDKAMPGTQSLLERHEWIKHGTCYPGTNADQYFKDAARLAGEVNTSPVQAFMAANIGKTVQSSDLRTKFDESFGSGAGQRVRVSCDKQGRISDITIGLKGNIPAGTAIKDLIAASNPTDAGCPSGLVDAVN